MAESLSVNVLSLFATLRSKSPHRGFQAAQLASDLYTLCIESVSDTELGEHTRDLTFWAGSHLSYTVVFTMLYRRLVCCLLRFSC